MNLWGFMSFGSSQLGCCWIQIDIHLKSSIVWLQPSDENLIEVQAGIVLFALHRVRQKLIRFLDLDEILLYLMINDQ